MSRGLLAAGSASAFLAVAAGAFGAHALRGMVDPGSLAVFETAARYHMYHSLAMLAAAVVSARVAHRCARTGGWLFAAGIVLFCGSLYSMALTGVQWLGAVTPIGGLLFLAGWACLVWSAFTERGSEG